MNGKRIGIAGSLLAVAAFAPAAWAGGKAKTTLKAEFQESAGQPAPHFYVGKVKSKKNACKKNRVVKLFGASDQLVTQGQSSAEGNFTLQEPTPAPSGEHTIKAPATDKCKRAKVTLFGGG
jgi:hypothetical protein